MIKIKKLLTIGVVSFNIYSVNIKNALLSYKEKINKNNPKVIDEAYSLLQESIKSRENEINTLKKTMANTDFFKNHKEIKEFKEKIKEERIQCIKELINIKSNIFNPEIIEDIDNFILSFFKKAVLDNFFITDEKFKEIALYQIQCLIKKSTNKLNTIEDKQKFQTKLNEEFKEIEEEIINNSKEKEEEVINKSKYYDKKNIARIKNVIAEKNFLTIFKYKDEINDILEKSGDSFKGISISNTSDDQFIKEKYEEKNTNHLGFYIARTLIRKNYDFTKYAITLKFEDFKKELEYINNKVKELNEKFKYIDKGELRDLINDEIISMFKDFVHSSTSVKIIEDKYKIYNYIEEHSKKLTMDIEKNNIILENLNNKINEIYYKVDNLFNSLDELKKIIINSQLTEENKNHCIREVENKLKLELEYKSSLFDMAVNEKFNSSLQVQFQKIQEIKQMHKNFNDNKNQKAIEYK